MARLMFANENEHQNNNDQPSSIAQSDNKCTDIIIMTTTDDSSDTSKTAVANTNYIGEFEIRSQLSRHGSPNPTYKATKVLVSESLVARLASKFNAVLMSEDNNGNGNGNGNGIGIGTGTGTEYAAVSTPRQLYPAEKAITVRNSSVQKTIKFFEKDLTNKTSSDVIKTAAAAATVKNSNKVRHRRHSASYSLEKNGSEINSPNSAADATNESQRAKSLEKIEKPELQPKPAIAIWLRKVSPEKKRPPEVLATDTAEAGNENKSLPQTGKKTESCNPEKLYHAPKIFVRKDRIDRNLMLKDKRLSIAKDFSLESVLNDDLIGHHGRPEDDKNETDLDSKQNTVNVIGCDSKMANSSFLHKYLEQCLENNKSAVEHTLKDDEDLNMYDQLKDSHCPAAPVKSFRNSSSLHDSLKTQNDFLRRGTSDGDYEDLSYSTASVMIMSGDRAEDADGDGHYHSADVPHNGDVYNVYADVIYAQLCNSREDDAENYETISSGSYGNSPTTLKDDLSLHSSVIMVHSDSESSLEQTNSLYEVKPTSDCSSARTSVFYSSNDCIHAKIGNIADLKSTSSGVSEEEEDYCDSDVNDHPEVTPVYRKRTNNNRSRKVKKRKTTRMYRKDYPQVPSYETSDIAEEFDDFDDSSSETESYNMNGRAQPTNQSRKQPLSNITQSQNIYELYEKARKTVRKRLSSLNPIRKMSVGNIGAKNQDEGSVPTNRSKSISVDGINLKNGHSVENGGGRWASFKNSKLKPQYKTISPTSSVFYVHPDDLLFNKSDNVTKKQSSANKERRRTTCVELRPATRPTSPPPPPPVDRLKISETNSVSTLSIYSDPSTRSSNSGSEINSELNSSRSSDLHLRFADEPLYQFYTDSIAQLTTTASFDCSTDSDGYEEIASNTSRPSAMDLITPSPTGHGQHRSLWSEVPEVMNSGILDTLSPSRKKLQEAIFEIITSEASYYKSLSVLDKIFANSAFLKDESVLSRNDWKVLFGNVAAVRKCSEKLLAALETCWQDSILLTGLSDVIFKHASENFRVYVKYCSNQIYIDRTLKMLKEQNSRFVEIVNQLESNSVCQSLNLHSFLMLPMQRITRMPLLIDAVLSKMDPLGEDAEYKTYQITLATLNKIVRDCNESARKLERYEEMLLLSRQLEFSRKDVKTFSVASSSRWLIRSGPMVHINPPDTKLTFTRKLTKQATKFYFFLFNDIMVVAKKKNDETYVVFDYCARNVVQMNLLEDSCTVIPAIPYSPYRYLLVLTILENHEGKTVEMILNCDSDSTRQRWLEATSSHLTSDNPEEKLYEEWDCPQVSAIHSYTAVQPDELSLHAGDVVKVLKKTTDGWCHGERIRDGITGWFPGNYTVEIASQHTRAKNLKLRHRLLTLSANYLQNQQQKKN